MNRLFRAAVFVSALGILGAVAGCGGNPASQEDLAAPADLAIAPDLTMSEDLTAPDLVAPDLISTPPIVTSVGPAGGNIALTPTVFVRFSQSMDTSTTMVSASPTATTGTPTWSNSDTLLAVPVTAPLTNDTTYTFTVSGTNKAGVALTGATTFGFTTLPFPDVTAPTITAFSPSDTSTNVSVQPTITISFSEPIAASTLNVVTTPGAPFRWTIAPDGKSAVGAPPTCVGQPVCVPVTKFLLPFANYTFKVAAKDGAGNALTGKTSYSLTTGPSPLTDIKSTVPSFEEEGFPIASNIQIAFTKAVDASTLNSTSIDFYEEASPSTKVGFAATLSGDKKTATINPSANLKTDTWYNIDIKPNSIALDGAPSTYLVPTTTGTFPATTAAIYKMAFSTAPDTTKPTVLSAAMFRVGAVSISNLVDGGAAISLAEPGQGIRVSFSEPMSASTSSAFVLKAGASGVPITVTWDAFLRDAYISLVDPYSYGTVYTLEIDKTLAVDRASNAIATSGKHSYVFTTPYVIDLTIDPDSGIELGPRTVYKDKPSDAENPQDPLWVGERNYFKTGTGDASVTQAICALAAASVGLPAFECVKLQEDKKWSATSPAATLLSFTLPPSVIESPSLIAANLTTSGAKVNGEPFSAALGPVLVESIYLTSFTDGNAIATGTLADAARQLRIAGTTFGAELRDKVVADVARAATQQSRSQIRIRTNEVNDGDQQDDVLIIEQPKLFISYLSATP